MKNKGFEYENKILKLMSSHGFVSSEFINQNTAGSDNTKPDLVLCLNNQDLNIELKKSLKSQAGGTSANYVNGKFKLVKDIEGVNQKDLFELLNSKKSSIDKFLEFHKSNTFPFTTTKERWNQSVDSGLLKGVNCSIECDASFIENHYERKNTYYIQIGGKGLYYMTKDVANLNVPRFNGKVKLEIRATRNGSRLNANGVRVCHSTLRLQARIENITKSSVNLENISSLERFKIVV